MSRTLDASDVILSLATHTDLVGTHRAAAVRTNGIAATPVSTTFTIPFAVVYPTPGREVQRNPELRRTQGTVTVCTAGAFLTGSQAGVSEADFLTIDGVVYEVSVASEWSALEGYYTAIMTRANLPG